MAADNGHRSIALPSLGAGGLQYPQEVVAKTILEAIKEYAKQNPSSSIRDVKVVIHHADQSIWQVIFLIHAKVDLLLVYCSLPLLALL